jgi:uncharacterized protein (DUF305 family)
MKKFNAIPVKIFPAIRFILVSTILIGLVTACKKDNDGLTIHHDNSKMMSLLHQMVKSMDSLNLTNDPDHDYAMLMKVHHKACIAMGDLELTEGNDPNLQEFAGQMISYRNQEIASLDTFLVTHQAIVNESRFRQEAEAVIEIMSNNADLQLLNGSTDHDFAMLLIQHHMSAINLVDLKVTYGKSDVLKNVTGIIKSRELQEIQDLQDWLLD